MTEDDWHAAHAQCLGVRLAGDAIQERDYKGQPITGDTLLILLNSHHEEIPFVLPAHKRGVRWEPLIDSSLPDGGESFKQLHGGESYPLQARSLVILSPTAPVKGTDN